MKKTKYFVLGMVLLLATAATLYAGGGQSGSRAGGKAKLEYWTWLTNQDVVAEFNKTQTDFEVEHVQMSHADINDKLVVALMSGAGAPDIATTTHRYFSLHGTTGKLYDLASSVRDIISGFPESLQSLVTLNGKVYALPADISPSVLWYRRDIFQQYNIRTPIETWDDYDAAARVLKNNGIYVMPIFNPAGTWGSNAISMFLGSRGANLFTADGKVIENNRDLEFALTYFYNMNKTGLGQSVTLFTPEFWGELKSGNIASWPMNVAEGANIKRNMPELSGKWGVMPFPKWNDKPEKLSGFWGGTVLMIPDQSRNKDNAVKFVKWLCGTVEGQIAASKAWNAVPALTAAYADSYYSQGDPYFGGDNVFAMINKTAPFYYYHWAVVEKILGEQIDLMFADRITPVQAREAIEREVMAAIR